MITVSYSEIQTFRACPHKHQNAYKERWVSPTTSPALERGTMFHSVLEEHYMAIRKMQKGKLAADDFADYVYKATAPLLYDKDGAQSEVQDLVSWLYTGYVEHYSLDSDWAIVATEHDAVVELPNEKLEPSGLFELKMKIDLIIKHKPTGKLYVVDHKTAANLPNNLELALDDQFGLYTWGLRQLGKKIHGSIHNCCRTQRNKTPGQTLESRHLRSPLYRTDRELDTIAIEAYLTMKRAYDIPKGMAERAPDTERCRYRCQYTESCLAGRKGIDERAFMKDLGFKQIFTRH